MVEAAGIERGGHPHASGRGYDQSIGDDLWKLVEAAGIEPASVSSPPSALHAYFVYCLTFHWPGEQGLKRRACFKFNCLSHKRGLAAIP